MEKKIKTIIEPFKIKMIEPISMISEKQRCQVLQEAYYNLFLIKAEHVLIDLLTDSGTGAMSAAQWGKFMEGDESYASCRSFYDFEAAVQELTGLKYIFPTHQGRAAERLLFTALGGEKRCGKGKYIINNTHFDTTRANLEYMGFEGLDFVIEEGKIPSNEYPFKGNMDLVKLENFIKEHGAESIPLCMITVTNNSGGGQPVSMKNIRETKKICKKYNIPLFFDACRFAENAYFIKLREEGYQDRTVKSIVQEMFTYVDGATMSAKKDGLANIGGFIAVNDEDLAVQIKNLEILFEGYNTYGGLAGRDLAAIAQGLKEVVDEDYLEYRIISAQYLGNALTKMGVPIVRPVGGHAVYIDAKNMLPHIPALEFPAQALACSLYLEGGIRTVEIGTFMFGKTGTDTVSPMELVRLAIPRRVYTQSHFDYIIEVMEYVNGKKNELCGFEVIYEPPYLRHFSAHLKPKGK
ncbi:MAG TPA: tryptophanase [Planctomycetota bacterium]|jgi:tryptophanase|nr:tryptophanase [Planctomycetota bacterium]HQA99797.1 tryptophanase [Planctomycetota bacterium]